MNEVVTILVALGTGAAGASWVWYFIVLPFMQAHKMLKECRLESEPVKHDSKLKHV